MVGPLIDGDFNNMFYNSVLKYTRRKIGVLAFSGIGLHSDGGLAFRRIQFGFEINCIGMARRIKKGLGQL